MRNPRSLRIFFFFSEPKNLILSKKQPHFLSFFSLLFWIFVVVILDCFDLTIFSGFFFFVLDCFDLTSLLRSRQVQDEGEASAEQGSRGPQGYQAGERHRLALPQP